MKLTAATAALTIALLSASIASAAGTGAWSVKDMKAAVRALGYPKPHPTKLACRGTTTFRCVATYRHHRRRVFYAQWQSMGGWLCAGAKVSNCKLLRHGFIPTADTGGSLPGAAQFASRGYMAIHYNDPQPFVASPCPQTGVPSTWTFCYKLDVGSVSVTITLKRVKTGYVTTASETRSG